jgi:CPA2 family monovalent cation:H+ antiporter-2
MPHATPLITTIVVGITLAFAFGALAHRLRASPLVGFLLAGVAVGPHTPGFVADQGLANELAEIGVILLMFGVGLHFSVRDLVSVRAIALPGAVVQMTTATALGLLLAWMLDWPMGSGIVFGLALSVASTVVLLRALQERRLINTKRGRIAVGWLIVEDIAMVLTLVLLPALVPLLGGERASAGSLAVGGIVETLLVTMAKVAAFITLMLVLGRRFIPWLLHVTAHLGSRELFRLGVLAIALGVAFGAAQLFDVSFALGAFFAGMILSESELSQQAAAETLPLRDAFAVLFFISVGMLFDPMILVSEPLPVLATVAIIIVGKSLAALGIVLAFGHPLRTALTISASLAQIGEFSFILAGLGVSLGLLSGEGRDLILAGALLSILVNPALFMALDRLGPWLDRFEAARRPVAEEVTPEPPAPAPTQLENHAVLIGYGRVGRRIGERLVKLGVPLFVMDEREEAVAGLREGGIEAASATAQTELALTNVAKARTLFVAIPESFEAGQIIAQARAANPDLFIIARAHSDAEAKHLSAHGADAVVLGEEEIAEAMLARFPDAQAPR